MIRLYAFPKDVSSTLERVPNAMEKETLLKSCTFHYVYDQDEHRHLSNSILRHDLFLNTRSADASGKIIKLENFQIDHGKEVILIKNKELVDLLKPIKTIRDAQEKTKLSSVPIIALLENFLELVTEKNFDLASTSTLEWKHGE